MVLVCGVAVFRNSLDDGLAPRASDHIAVSIQRLSAGTDAECVVTNCECITKRLEDVRLNDVAGNAS